MSSSLTERHDGRKNLSYFGTGETFLFTLSPASHSYHWDQNLHHSNGDGFEELTVSKKPMRKKSHYVFVDTIPLIKDLDNSDSTSTKKKSVGSKDKTRKTSMKRRLSKKLNLNSSSSSSSASSKPGFDRSVSRSAYSKRPDQMSVSLHPLSAINLRHSSYSVPKRLYLGSNTSSTYKALVEIPENYSAPSNLSKRGNPKKLNTAHTIDIGNLKKLQKSSNVIIEDDDEDGLVMNKNLSVSDTNSGAVEQHAKFTKSETIEEEEDEETLNIKMTNEGAAAVSGQQPSSEQQNGAGGTTGDIVDEKKTIGLFISCDDIRIIVGGG